MRKSFHTLIDALEYLNADPDYIAFNLKGNILEHPETKERYPLNRVAFLTTIKFEEQSTPDDVSMLHIIETNLKHKGYFIDASGMYSVLDIG